MTTDNTPIDLDKLDADGKVHGNLTLSQAENLISELRYAREHIKILEAQSANRLQAKLSFQDQLFNALDLLKEFVEATDEMVTACKQGYARDTERMERALKKFKEWK